MVCRRRGPGKGLARPVRTLGGVRSSPPLEASAEIPETLAVVYERLVSFERYPEFLPGLVAVRRLSPRRLSFEAQVAGTNHQWPARITEQRRGRSVAMAVDERFRASARVHLHPVGPRVTALGVALDFDVDPFRERLLTLLLDPQQQLEAGVARFVDWVVLRDRR